MNRLEAALSLMTERQREAHRYRLESLTLAQIGQKLGSSKQNIQKLLSRGIKRALKRLT